MDLDLPLYRHPTLSRLRAALRRRSKALGYHARVMASGRLEEDFESLQLSLRFSSSPQLRLELCALPGLHQVSTSLTLSVIKRKEAGRVLLRLRDLLGDPDPDLLVEELIRVHLLGLEDRRARRALRARWLSLACQPS